MNAPGARLLGRYTLSLHFVGINHQNNHVDLFLDIDKDHLVQYSYHYRSENVARLRGQKVLMKLGTPHRRRYLTYQGEISGGRGRVRILKSGKFRIPSWMHLDQLKPNVRVMLP